MRVAMTGSDGNLSPTGTTVETVTLESDEGGGDEVKARKQESSTSTRREEQEREETIFAVGSSKVST